MLGVSKQAISKRVKAFEADGVLEVRQVGRERRVHAAKFLQLVGNATDPAQGLRNPEVNVSGLALETKSAREEQGIVKNSSQASYNEAKAKRAVVEAERARLEYEELIGNIVRKEDADARMFENFRKVRDRLTGLPTVCADALASAPDARTIRTMLSDEIRKILDGLAEEFDQADTDDAGS
ncbi:conserved hypothetical protein [Roseibium sp. TrichSKD4]|nr:conserved hypothetical protein [Roseibium sp. TrichSKD4]